MKKQIAIVMLFLALVAAGLVAAAILFSPQLGRLVGRVAERLQPKYPPLIGKCYPEDAHPTEKQKQWVLATCAVLTQRNGDCHEILGGQTNREDVAKFLARDWGVHSRKDLMSALRGLEYGGHRKGYDEWVTYLERLAPEHRGQAWRHIRGQGGSASNRLAVVLATRDKFRNTGLAGWDFSRYVALCGWGKLLGYLSEEEAWQLSMPVARLLQESFSSWNELAENFAEGRRFWSVHATLKGEEDIRDAINTLLWNAHSPWARLKWNTNLLPEKQQNDGSAEFREGLMWFDGFGEYPKNRAKDWPEATRLFHLAAAKGNVDAMYWLGLCYGWGAGVETNQAQSCEWYQKAADRGDGPSMDLLGRNYHWGRGVPKDKRKAFELVAQAITNGCRGEAETFLGWCYEEGQGVEKSISEAVRLYQAAADKGEPWAQTNLGECYMRGAGVERSLFQAAKWFKRSALGGHKAGMFYWAECLENGTGTTRNEAEALSWYRKSAEKGHAKAKKRLSELESQARTP